MQGVKDAQRQGRQLRNGMGMCMDLEHQHVFGPLIQWRCKNVHNYKSNNQLFTWVAAI